ncbi:FAD-dependent oxidoreductase domain-containing protein 1-like [Homarus americanus]|uniref:FAD-dependent oxidoreductase domain-containing protein 1-like n=1 Tax=Homarus americanus TaxID=6706 RepID=UPI001C477332|nr:FAD-dependent oxidoreductase domain-containing protein 1-like [Homarus americanus]
MYCITRTSLRRLGEQWTGVSYSQVKSVFEYSDVSRRGLSSSSTTCSDRHDDPPNSQDNKNQNFRRHKYANPLQRTIGILSDDVKGFFFGVQSRFPTTGKTLDGGDPRPEPQDRLGEVWPSHCDVLVVGGGVMGSSIAYHLKERALQGLNVVVVEEDPTYTRASTVLSVGGIRQQFSVPENIQLSMYGMEFLRKAPQLLGVEGMDPPDMQFNPHGYLTLASEAGVHQLEENYTLQRDLGAKVDFMSAAQLKDKFPWLNTDGVEGGVLGLENEGWFDPWSLLFSLRRKAVSLGTQYVNGRVTGLESQILDDAILETDYRSNVKNLRKAEITLANGEKRNIHFAILVLAAGAWSGEIGRLVGIGKGDGVMAAPIPVEPRKRYVYCVHAPDGPGLNSPLVIDPNGTYFRREGLGGNYLCGQSPHEDNEPPVDDLKVDEKFFEDEVWPTIANRVPSFENLKLHTSWAGYYDYNTFDQNGIIGLHPLVSNMFIATGFSGHGIQQAAGVGRAIMECILLGEYRTINLERLGFERILLNEPLYEKNIV